MPKTIETRTQKVSLRDDGIIFFLSFPNSEHSLSDAKENVAAAAALGDGRKRPCLVDLRQLKSMSREARAYYAGDETAQVEAAAALLVASLVSKIIGNFFMGINKPVIPTRLFTSEAQAVEWLRSFL